MPSELNTENQGLSGSPSNSQVRAAHEKAVGGKRDKCNIGKSCSAACITRSDRCLVDIPVSPSRAASSVRDTIEGEKSRQLQLIKASDVVSERDAKRNLVQFKRENERNIVSALGAKDKDKYEEHRQKVIDYNKMLVREGLDKKTGLINVPVSWERAEKVSSAYLRAYTSISDRMEGAAKLGDRETYDKEERKLMQLQRRLGVKVGDSEVIRKGKIWEMADGDKNARNEFFAGLREGKSLKGASMELSRDSLTISKMISGHNVSIVLEDNGRGFSFQIDGSYEKPDGLSNRVGMRISKATEEMFNDVVSSMREGSVVGVYPYDGDGRGDKRRRAYERYGFGSVPGESYMYGSVYMGKMTPATRLDMEDFDNEGYLNFVELSKKERAKLFYTILWGEELSRW